MQQYKAGISYERILVDIAGLFSESGHQAMATDYFKKRPEAYTWQITVAKALIQKLFSRFWMC